MAFDPITAGLGLGASVAGGIISRNEAQKNAESVAKARNAVLTDYLKRQDALAQEGRGYLDANVAKYAPGNTQLSDAQATRTGSITGTMGDTSDPNAVTVSGSAPEAVRGEIAKRMLGAFQRATTRAKAMGTVGGYGDQWFNNNVDINNTNRQVGTVNNFARGNSAILPSQLDLAEIGARKQPSIWGSVLSAGGGAALNAAGSGWSPFGSGQGFATVDATNQALAAFPKPI